MQIAVPGKLVELSSKLECIYTNRGKTVPVNMDLNLDWN